MKRLAVTLGSLMLVAAVAYPVIAWGPRWGHGRHHMVDSWGYAGSYGTDYYDKRYRGMTQEKTSSMDRLRKEFFDETAKLRDEIWSKSNELDMQLNSPSPDTEKGKAVQKEVSELKAKLAEKELNFGLKTRRIAPNGGYAQGYDRDRGRHMRDYGWHMGGRGPGGYWN